MRTFVVFVSSLGDHYLWSWRVSHCPGTGVWHITYVYHDKNAVLRGRRGLFFPFNTDHTYRMELSESWLWLRVSTFPTSVGRRVGMSTPASSEPAAVVGGTRAGLLCGPYPHELWHNMISGGWYNIQKNNRHLSELQTSVLKLDTSTTGGVVSGMLQTSTGLCNCRMSSVPQGNVPISPPFYNILHESIRDYPNSHIYTSTKHLLSGDIVNKERKQHLT